MSTDLIDDGMKTQLSREWDRFRKALSQAGDIGGLNLGEWRILATRDRKGLPPAVSVATLQRLITLEKSGQRGQAIRGGEETKDPTMLHAAQARAGELRLQDADHSEAYAVLAYQAGRRLGLSENQAVVFGDAVAYLLTGWSQAHAEARHLDRVMMEFKKEAGSPPEGGFVWSDLHTLMSRKGFKQMVEAARAIGTVGAR
jgi:hypothetical protein